MRVGVFAKDTSDDGLRFLKQIGVDDVDVRLEYLEEYRTSGSLTAASARRVVERCRVRAAYQRREHRDRAPVGCLLRASRRRPADRSALRADPQRR